MSSHEHHDHRLQINVISVFLWIRRSQKTCAGATCDHAAGTNELLCPTLPRASSQGYKCLFTILSGKKAKVKKFLTKRQQHQGHIINTAHDSAVVTAVIITSTLTLFGTDNNCSSSKSGMFLILGEGFQPFNLLGAPLLWFVFYCVPNILNG